jgi:hypothetical protein
VFVIPNSARVAPAMGVFKSGLSAWREGPAQAVAYASSEALSEARGGALARKLWSVVCRGLGTKQGIMMLVPPPLHFQGLYDAASSPPY